MPRYFNTAGVCEPRDHYMPPLDRLPGVVPRLALCLFPFVLAAPSFGDGDVLPKLANPGFEHGALGELPPSWRLAEPYVESGYRAELTDVEPHEGERCASLARLPDTGGPYRAGLMSQVIDPSDFRGKRVRLTAALRAAVGSRAQLMFRVDRTGGRSGFSDDMSYRPVTSSAWQVREILGEVAEDAEQIFVAAMLPGNGKLWIDSVRLEAVGDVGEGDVAPRPLTDRGLANLTAMARLLGFVRYFHPSDEAAAADWDRVAIDGVERVEDAAGPAELARKLEEVFRPLAPTVRVFAAGEPVPKAEAPEGAKGLRTVAWVHDGVGTGNPRSIYGSRRVFQSPPDPKVLLPRKREPVPEPGERIETELGGGVACRVPLALHADAEGTLPSPPSALASVKPERFLPTASDRSTRLAGVALAWNVFQHFYPYFDVVETDWAAALEEALKKAATDTGPKDYLETLRLFLARLHDGHGWVWGPGSRGNFVPPIAWSWIENHLVVTAVAEDGAFPLRRGDAVLAVDGKPAARALAEVEAFIPSATPQWKRWRGLRGLLAGDEGSELSLAVERRSFDGGESERFDVVLERTLSGDDRVAEPRPDPLNELAPGILYFDLNRLPAEVLEEALPKLAEARGVVFDMRGYPGPGTFGILAHLSGETLRSAQWHVPKVIYPDRRELAFVQSGWPVNPEEPRVTENRAFLIDGRAISAAETFMGIVEHYGLGEIVGSATAGTNGNVNPFLLPGGYRVDWTGMKVLKHDGSRHHGVGILPTVPVERTIEGVAAGRDEYLEKAVEITLTPNPSPRGRGE